MLCIGGAPVRGRNMLCYVVTPVFLLVANANRGLKGVSSAAPKEPAVTVKTNR